MSKNTASDEHSNVKSRFSPSQLARKPIHGETAEKEKDGSEEEIAPKPRKNLYPSVELKEDLEALQNRTVKVIVKSKISSVNNKPGIGQKRQLPKHASIPKEEPDKSGYFSSWKAVIFFLLSFVMLLIGIKVSQRETPAPDRTIDLTEFISDMKNKFQGQDPQTFHILKSSLKRVLDESSKPASPSIFTIVTNKGAEITASDFSTHIAQELASEHYVSINESVFHRNADHLKYVIDTEIRSKFDNRSLNVAVVDRIHNIPIDSAMIFHSYCDHENAPFKRAIFLFIVHLNRKIPENSSVKFVDDAAMEALRSVWRDASDDVVDSLITRLTVNVINIK